MRGIRERLGGEYPLLVKLACHDGGPEGLRLEESIRIAAMAEPWGLDAVEVSGGMRRGMNIRRPRDEDREGFFRREAAAFKQALAIPVISVHGYRSLEVMERVVAEGTADMVALCRPLIREPDLVHRFSRGELTRSACISCNRCLAGQPPLRCRAAEAVAG